MKRLDHLITDIRELTGNEQYGAAEGVRDRTIIKALNEGHRLIQGSILRNIASCTLFDERAVFSLVAQQSDYILPGVSGYAGTPVLAGIPFGGQSVRMVEYTCTGNDSDYAPLRSGAFFEGTSYVADPPSSYYVRDRRVCLSPTPNSSSKKIRVTYPSRVCDLDIPRGTVTDVNDAGGYYTDLEISGVVTSSDDDTELGRARYLSIESPTGDLIYPAIQGSWNSTTKVWTITDSTAPTTSGTISTGADYVVVIGQRGSAFLDSRLPLEAEDFISLFAQLRLLRLDSSIDVKDVKEELTAIENNILISLGGAKMDLEPIPTGEGYWFD